METSDPVKDKNSDTVGFFLVCGRWNILLNICLPS